MAGSVGLHGQASTGPETALSGAGGSGQDDDAGIDSPAPALPAGSQISVALAGSNAGVNAAHSARQPEGRLGTIDSALSIADMTGPASETEPVVMAEQQAAKPAPPSAKLAASPAASATSGRAQLNAHNPTPRCEFPSVQRNISAATSVEAVQQDGDDDGNVHGAATFPASSQAGATSMPSAHLTTGQHPSSISSRLPVTPVLHQLSPASAGRSQLEHRESVVFDNDIQVLASSPSSQQLSELPAYSSKRQRVYSSAAPHSARLHSPQGSGASEGHPQTSVHLCQAGHNTSQQGIVAEACSGQQFDEEAQQSVHNDPAVSYSQDNASPSVSLDTAPAAIHYVALPAVVSHGTSARIADDHSYNHNRADQQQHTTASNDGSPTGNSLQSQQNVAASIQATGHDEDMPASDAETDLSAIGPVRVRHATGTARQQRRPRTTQSSAVEPLL